MSQLGSGDGSRTKELVRLLLATPALVAEGCLESDTGLGFYL